MFACRQESPTDNKDVYTYMYYIHAHVCTHRHAHIKICLHVHISMKTYTCTCAYTHTCILNRDAKIVFATLVWFADFYVLQRCAFACGIHIEKCYEKPVWACAYTYHGHCSKSSCHVANKHTFSTSHPHQHVRVHVTKNVYTYAHTLQVHKILAQEIDAFAHGFQFLIQGFCHVYMHIFTYIYLYIYTCMCARMVAWWWIMSTKII